MRGRTLTASIPSASRNSTSPSASTPKTPCGCISAADMYDVFFSNHTATGGELAARLQAELEAMEPDLRVFSAVDSATPGGSNAHDLTDDVRASRCFVLLVTPGVFESEVVMGELLAAVRSRRRIIVLWDADSVPELPRADALPSLAVPRGATEDEIRNAIRAALETEPVRAQKAASEDALVEELMRRVRFAGGPDHAHGHAGDEGAGADAERPSAAPRESDATPLEPPTDGPEPDLVVDSRGPPHGLPSVAAAVERASPGQTVFVAPGRYYESVVLDKEVHLQGMRGTILESRGGQPALVCRGPASPTVRGFTIVGRSKRDCAVLLTEGTRALLERCSVTSAGPAGVEASGEGTAPTVRGNCVHDCTQSGIWVHGGAGGTLEGNDICRCAWSGVEITERADPVVRGNRIRDGLENGIMVAEARGTVEENDVYGNAEAGIEITRGAEPVVRGNKFHDEKFGIVVSSEGRGGLESNELWGNEGAAIQIRKGADPLVISNHIHDEKHGVWVYEGGKGTIRDNAIENLDAAWAQVGGVLVEEGSTPVVGSNSFTMKRDRAAQAAAVAEDSRGS
eukprot:tig00020801_g13970.t1